MIGSTLRRFALVAGIAVLPAAALAADPSPAASADPTPAQRQTMAEIHRKMADCLASEQPFAECRAQMQQSCVTMMGPTGCPMMGGGIMRGPGMMQGQGMMGGPSASPPSDK